MIPWGIAPEVYRPDVPALLLPEQKQFKFLFVGGTIARKGFDTLLDAYLAEFTGDDDVCLVVKSIGSNSFYRYGNLTERVTRAAQDPKGPAILYTEDHYTDGQLASLYAACDCLVAPYRGEGFGLPILEAMACGVAPLVPRGGASDDFVTEETGILLPSQEVEAPFDEPLCGPPQVLSVRVEDVRAAMRAAYESPEKTKTLGRKAAEHVSGRFTWSNTAAAMLARIQELASRSVAEKRVEDAESNRRDTVAVCMLVQDAEKTLAESVARVSAFVDELLVADLGSVDRSAMLATEYGAKVVTFARDESNAKVRRSCEKQLNSQWMLWLSPRDVLAENDAERLRELVKQQNETIAEFTCSVNGSQLYTSRGKPTKTMRFTRRETPSR